MDRNYHIQISEASRDMNSSLHAYLQALSSLSPLRPSPATHCICSACGLGHLLLYRAKRIRCMPESLYVWHRNVPQYNTLDLVLEPHPLQKALGPRV